MADEKKINLEENTLADGELESVSGGISEEARSAKSLDDVANLIIKICNNIGLKEPTISQKVELTYLRDTLNYIVAKGAHRSIAYWHACDQLRYYGLM